MAEPESSKKRKYSDNFNVEIVKLEAAMQKKQELGQTSTSNKKAKKGNYTKHGIESGMIFVTLTEWELYRIRKDYKFNRLASFLDGDDKKKKGGKMDTSPWSNTASRVRITVLEAALLNELRWVENRKDELISISQGKTGEDLDDWNEASINAAWNYNKNIHLRTLAMMKSKKSN